MKKLLMVLISLCLLWGCSSQESVVIDLASLGKQMQEEIKFDDELNLMSTDMIPTIYGIDNAIEAYAYMGSQATAEEIALFKFANDKDAKAGKEALEAHLEKQKQDYASYIPEEVVRIEKAVLRQEGNYVLLCVSYDEGVNDIIDKNIQK
ncbi:MAG: DUF4358 domain-containing protein [Erysipelotrichaceae bacterium]|nr:DUF4358 domain-containing protein [Erysipelotrichaceae bacterium]MDY5252137.1 DUF4358 domain-containing protein [Erysipelotrichaceae bacterium]